MTIHRARDPALRVSVLTRVSDGWWEHLTRPFAHLRHDRARMLWLIDHYPGVRPHAVTDN